MRHFNITYLKSFINKLSISFKSFCGRIKKLYVYNKTVNIEIFLIKAKNLISLVAVFDYLALLAVFVFLILF